MLLLYQGFLLDSESWNQLNGVNLEISMICGCGWSAVAVILICMSLAARLAVSID